MTMTTATTATASSRARLGSGEGACVGVAQRCRLWRRFGFRPVPRPPSGGQSEAMNESIPLAVERGAIVLVAAGNDNGDAWQPMPANPGNHCPGCSLFPRPEGQKRAVYPWPQRGAAAERRSHPRRRRCRRHVSGVDSAARTCSARPTTRQGKGPNDEGGLFATRSARRRSRLRKLRADVKQPRS